MHRTDANQQQIVKALRAVGCSVVSTAAVCNGFVDLCVGRNGITYCLEIKDGSKPPSAQRLTAYEAIFRNEWKGHYALVRNVREALAAVGADMQ